MDKDVITAAIAELEQKLAELEAELETLLAEATAEARADGAQILVDAKALLARLRSWVSDL